MCIYGTVWIRSYIRALMIGTEMVPETSVIFNQMLRFLAVEDFV
jgi:hypothetical protein